MNFPVKLQSGLDIVVEVIITIALIAIVYILLFVVY